MLADHGHVSTRLKLRQGEPRPNIIRKKCIHVSIPKIYFRFLLCVHRRQLFQIRSSVSHAFSLFKRPHRPHHSYPFLTPFLTPFSLPLTLSLSFFLCTMSFRPLLLCILLVVALYSSPASARRVRVHPWFAATCIAKSGHCTKYYARRSGNRCTRYTIAHKQSKRCLQYACSWCRTSKSRLRKLPCRSKPMRHLCKYRGIPSPYLKKQRKTCTWTGSDHVVVDLSHIRPSGGWTRCNRAGYQGLQFTHSPYEHITPPGKRGVLCFSIRANVPGSFFVAALSYAPHPTEHNDVWVRSSLGFKLRKFEKAARSVRPNHWIKAYQNNGKKGMSHLFRSVDHDGHSIMVPNVAARKRFQICVAGRSTLYEMYRIMLVKCTSMFCHGAVMQASHLNQAPSKCI